ncbi:sulfate-binding protein precursor [Clostridium homopropionicum DSM 5847]|uniref:Sulfate-binding protein n=1 Tax=Clostridium homopropionicum DSM 5847 TaxID=1121318 RepID=A0A0L6ZD58_9CLOT|nr:sulfate ABC transporter substrate-binding protein [Clostridium homopropionicum]KOA20713.1 sulfate-binding protein precursor [Clostridium homopropionicum DSM 5847]SFF90890.1 sulfate transport system substrate-binding protein [Clostridium homopropionicum]
MNKNKLMALGLIFVLTVGVVTGCGKSKSVSSNNKVEITNVSYDPTRELYESYNKEFVKYWKDKAGQDVNIIQSHGGSGKQARSVIEGNEADVVTLALAQDITAIEKAGLIDNGWIKEFNKNSSPYTSTIVFLVRKGNPKNIKDWDDLVKKGVNIITPNPKTSGGARWNFLAAWAYADKKFNGDKEKTKQFVSDLYKNVSILDSGARAATTTFVENGQGDVLIAWENEAYLSVREHKDQYEIITPSISILAEPSVAVVDKTAKKRGTEEVAKAYLEYLYSDVGQKIAGDNYYRPSNKEILQKYSNIFNLNIKMVTIDDFGGWDKATKDFFQDGAVFDQIYKDKSK